MVNSEIVLSLLTYRRLPSPGATGLTLRGRLPPPFQYVLCAWVYHFVFNFSQASGPDGQEDRTEEFGANQGLSYHRTGIVLAKILALLARCWIRPAGAETGSGFGDRLFGVLFFWGGDRQRTVFYTTGRCDCYSEKEGLNATSPSENPAGDLECDCDVLMCR